MDSAHPPFLSLLFSDDFPGHFEPGPPRRGELFAFHSVMLFEAEDAVMRLKRPCCPTVRTFHYAGAALRPRLEVDGNLHPGKRTLGRIGRWRAVSCESASFHRVRRDIGLCRFLFSLRSAPISLLSCLRCRSFNDGSCSINDPKGIMAQHEKRSRLL